MTGEGRALGYPCLSLGVDTLVALESSLLKGNVRTKSFFISAEDPRSQVLELENELELQQQQIKDLQTKLEQERKVREMLVLRLTDEQRAR